MAAKSKRFKSIVDLAENEEAVAASAMSKAIAQYEKMKNSLSELEKYEGEYQDKFRTFEGQQFSIHQLNEYRRFLTQINQGISQQQKSIEAALQEVAAKRAAWIEKHNRTRALSKVLENYKLEEQIEEDEREQNLQDEFSMRIRRN